MWGGWNMRPLAWWNLPWSQKIVSTSLPSTWRPSWGPASAECLWQSDWKRRPSSLRHPEETSRKQVTWSTFSNLREDKETRIQNNNFHTHTEYYIHDCNDCWKQFERFLHRLNLINTAKITITMLRVGQWPECLSEIIINNHCQQVDNNTTMTTWCLLLQRR